MTTANEEFLDLMPHRIEVTSEGIEWDDRGQPVNTGVKRTYACLLDDAQATSRTEAGTSVDTVFTAYVAPVPLETPGGEPVDIKSTETVKIIVPYEEVVSVKTVEHHYDSEEGIGALHNIVLRFS